MKMSNYKKILKMPLRVSLAVLLSGVLAKMFEWPYAKEIVLYSFIAIGVLYTIRFFQKNEKQFIDFTKLALVTFFSLYGIFTILEFPYTLFFLVLMAITFVMWFVMEGTAYFLDDDRRAKNSIYQILWNCALVVGTLGVISGSLLKILNWDYAVHILSIGLTIVAAYILKDVFVPESSKQDEQGNEGYQI